MLRGLRSRIGQRLLLRLFALSLAPLATLAAVLASLDAVSPALATWLPAAAALAGSAALAVALHVGAGLVGRLDDLTDTIQRITHEDFTARAPEGGGDEIARLGETVNALSESLASKVAGRNALAQIDETLLGRSDTAALMRLALRFLRGVAQAELAIIGQFESPASDTMRVFLAQKGDRSRIQDGRVQMSREAHQELNSAEAGALSNDCPFPAPFADRLRSEFGAQHFAVLPVLQPGGAWGLMVAASRSPIDLDPEQISLLGSVGARLVAGFRHAERERKLQEFAQVDAITGLPNHVALVGMMREELASAHRGNAMVAVLRVELDRMRQLTEAHGPEFADRVLRQAAHRVRAQVREEDLVARSGPNEIAVVLPGVHTPREAGAAARKLVQALLHKFQIGNHAVLLGACVGVAIYPSDGDSVEVLFRNAAAARDRARAEGGDRFTYFEEPMNLELRRRSALEVELRDALSKDQLELHYQPQFDLRTGYLCGVEALVRWRHPTRGLLYPRDFISFAEESGLALEIGEFVLRRACESHERWREQGVIVPRVSINLARGQLLAPLFAQRLRDLMARTRMPPDNLEIEVTETMLVEGADTVARVLDEVASAGVRIAIDDFGTGFSSFTHLRNIPVGVLKMDMSFLVDATPENEAGKIVAAIINMAHALRKEVVAEGVERVEQLKLLKQLGCERAQGYLFGRVVEPEQVERLFRKKPAIHGEEGLGRNGVEAPEENPGFASQPVSNGFAVAYQPATTQNFGVRNSTLGTTTFGPDVGTGDGPSTAAGDAHEEVGVA